MNAAKNCQMLSRHFGVRLVCCREIDQASWADVWLAVVEKYCAAVCPVVVGQKQTAPDMDSHRLVYFVDIVDFADSWIVVPADRMVVGHGPMHGPMLDLVEILAYCSTVDWLLAGDSGCQIFDSDRCRGHCIHFVDCMSRDYSCCRGYSTAAY